MWIRLLFRVTKCQFPSHSAKLGLSGLPVSVAVTPSLSGYTWRGKAVKIVLKAAGESTVDFKIKPLIYMSIFKASVEFVTCF